MHDARHFSNPESFIPTRWIESERGNETCNRSAWIPFSYGPRNCIGKPQIPLRQANFRLALMQLRLTVALFVWHFDAEFAGKQLAPPYYKDAFVALRGPLPVRISTVKRNGERRSANEMQIFYLSTIRRSLRLTIIKLAAVLCYLPFSQNRIIYTFNTADIEICTGSARIALQVSLMKFQRAEPYLSFSDKIDMLCLARHIFLVFFRRFTRNEL